MPEFQVFFEDFEEEAPEKTRAFSYKSYPWLIMDFKILF